MFCIAGGQLQDQSVSFSRAVKVMLLEMCDKKNCDTAKYLCKKKAQGSRVKLSFTFMLHPV